MRLTYKLEEPINTKYLHYDYMVIADYDISRGNYGRITDSEIYNKLGQLEDIDENPEHLADIKKALEAIKNTGILKPYETSDGQCWLETMCDAIKISKETYNLFKKVSL